MDDTHTTRGRDFFTSCYLSLALTTMYLAGILRILDNQWAALTDRAVAALAPWTGAGAWPTPLFADAPRVRRQRTSAVRSRF